MAACRRITMGKKKNDFEASGSGTKKTERVGDELVAEEAGTRCRGSRGDHVGVGDRYEREEGAPGGGGRSLTRGEAARKLAGRRRRGALQCRSGGGLGRLSSRRELGRADGVRGCSSRVEQRSEGVATGSGSGEAREGGTGGGPDRVGDELVAEEAGTRCRGSRGDHVGVGDRYEREEGAPGGGGRSLTRGEAARKLAGRRRRGALQCRSGGGLGRLSSEKGARASGRRAWLLVASRAEERGRGDGVGLGRGERGWDRWGT
nr:uncharacterized protein LOC127339487 [Lolium perenne]